MTRLLVVEDEEDLLKGLEINLLDEGYEVLTATRGDEALELAMRENLDLIILDIMLPEMNGLDVCRALRSRSNDVPIIMLTARADEIHRVVGLEMGADDYVTKPFSLPELLARVRANLRRYQRGTGPRPHTCSFADIEIDFDAYTARRAGDAIHLTPTEFELLRLLIANKGSVVSRDKILNEVWGYSSYPTTRTVDNHILKLRQKLGDDSKDPKYIVAVYGEGYKFIG